LYFQTNFERRTPNTDPQSIPLFGEMEKFATILPPLGAPLKSGKIGQNGANLVQAPRIETAAYGVEVVGFTRESAFAKASADKNLSDPERFLVPEDSNLWP
jgi:hypothetical protein